MSKRTRAIADDLAERERSTEAANLVSAAAEAEEVFDVDELEAHAREFKASGQSPAHFYRKDKPSRAIIALTRGRGLMLAWIGHALWSAIDALGDKPRDLKLTDAPGDGIWVWEGAFNEYDPEDERLSGSWRTPTDEELCALEDDEHPWDPKEWEP